MMQNRIAYLSEWGNNSLDFSKKGSAGQLASIHFIVAAVITENEGLSTARSILEAIRQRYFNGGSIDSDVIDNDHIKRKEILQDLEEVDFKIFALIVDKRQLSGQGLRFKGSFFKFMHGLADRELSGLFPDLEMVTSHPGDDSFMKGFISYVQQNHISNLFNESAFGFTQVQNNLLVQTAGFIAGSLARCYDETVITDQRTEFIEVLKRKLLTITFWPDAFEQNLANPPEPGPNYDPLLAELSVKLANGFLARKSSDRAQQSIDQVSCLGYLLFHFRHINPTRYITSSS